MGSCNHGQVPIVRFAFEGNSDVRHNHGKEAVTNFFFLNNYSSTSALSFFHCHNFPQNTSVYSQILRGVWKLSIHLPLYNFTRMSILSITLLSSIRIRSNFSLPSKPMIKHWTCWVSMNTQTYEIWFCGKAFLLKMLFGGEYWNVHWATWSCKMLRTIKVDEVRFPDGTIQCSFQRLRDLRYS